MKQLTVFHTEASLLTEFSKQGVRFLVIGGLAVHLHLPERDVAGVDLDILIESTPENADRVFNALSALGMNLGFDRVLISQTSERPQQLCLKPYYNVDLVTTGRHIDFASEWDQSEEAIVSKNQVRYATKELLVRMKRKTGRYKDLHDIALLEPKA